MTGHFEIKGASDGRFLFNLKAGNGEIVLTSSLFDTKDAVAAAIATVKENALNDLRYERKVAKNDHPYFLLETADGDVLGRSETYSSKSAMENGIKSVMRAAPDALVKDVSEIEAGATH